MLLLELLLLNLDLCKDFNLAFNIINSYLSSKIYLVFYDISWFYCSTNSLSSIIISFLYLFIKKNINKEFNNLNILKIII